LLQLAEVGAVHGISQEIGLHRQRRLLQVALQRHGRLEHRGIQLQSSGIGGRVQLHIQSIQPQHFGIGGSVPYQLGQKRIIQLAEGRFPDIKGVFQYFRQIFLRRERLFSAGGQA